MGNTIVGGGVVDDLPHFLPEQVLIEILVRLPVVSLLRFMSVCKSWQDLIQTSFFIHLHATFNSSSSSSCSKFGHNTFILQTRPIIAHGADGRLRRETKMFMLSFRSGRSSDGGGDDIEDDDDDDQVVFKMDDLRFPPYYSHFRAYMINMVGSCHGLICVHNLEHRDVSLWNPATRQFRILPKSITIQEEGIGKFSLDFVAFGFDVKTKDYKVVHISRFIGRAQWRCPVQVYSLSTDSWRLLEGINSLPTDDREPFLLNQGVYLNGSYFFVGKKSPYHEPGEISSNYFMLSFDFTKEIFTTMQLPDLDDNIHRIMLLTHLDDKIAFFAIRIKSSFFDDEPRDCDDDYENYDIWVLDEQGGGDAVNKESWVKLHSLRIKERVAREWMKPRGMLNNGEFALTETNTDGMLNELHLLNLVTKEPVKSFPIREQVSRADIYKHSLVSIIGGNDARSSNQ